MLTTVHNYDMTCIIKAPSRHGAHNWEGVGQKTVVAALDAFGQATARRAAAAVAAGGGGGGGGADDLVANVKSVIVAGHSMGGHGAWLMAVTSPDRVRAVNPNAGWLCKEFYGDSNTPFLFDSRLDSVDHRLRYILEASIAENCATSMASNLRGTAVYARVGSKDQTVPAWFSRRMMRIMSEEFVVAAGMESGIGNERAENGAKVGASSAAAKNPVPARFDEIPGKEHWWWDSDTDNDGGAVNDGPIRDFFAAAAGSPPAALNSFILTAMNPAAVGSMQGIRIIQQLVRSATLSLNSALSCYDVIVAYHSLFLFFWVSYFVFSPILLSPHPRRP